MVDPIGIARGLAVWWKHGIDIEIINSCQYWIDAIVKEVSKNFEARCTWMYGTPYQLEKATFWESMSDFDRKDGLPWLVIGDLNEVLWQKEKEGGARWNPRRKRYLLDFMNFNNLLDLGYKGQRFTWARNNGDHCKLRERLDRGLSNTQWLVCWPDRCVHHEPCVGFDHCPLFFIIEPNSGRKKSIFKFEAKWLEEPDCKEVICATWDTPTYGPPCKQWCEKLKKCQVALKQWSKEKVQNCRP